MRLTGSALLTTIFIAAAGLTSIYILYRLGREKGAAHALLGFIFPPYAYIWGWLNSRRLEIMDVMVFWTFMSLAAFLFPLLMGFTDAPASISEPGFTSNSFSASDVQKRGSISPGSEVRGRIDELFAVDEWTFTGAAGQQVSIQCAPAGESDTDPRINLLDPGGSIIASDDDGGEGKTASLTSVSLPATGTYTIRVDVWMTGPYTLTLE